MFITSIQVHTNFTPSLRNNKTSDFTFNLYFQITKINHVLKITFQNSFEGLWSKNI